MTKKFIYVRIRGSAINEMFKAVSHEVKAYPSNTYHVFEMPNGAKLWVNDFGIQSLSIADSQAALTD